MYKERLNPRLTLLLSSEILTVSDSRERERYIFSIIRSQYSHIHIKIVFKDHSVTINPKEPLNLKILKQTITCKEIHNWKSSLSQKEFNFFL